MFCGPHSSPLHFFIPQFMQAPSKRGLKIANELKTEELITQYEALNQTTFDNQLIETTFKSDENNENENKNIQEKGQFLKKRKIDDNNNSKADNNTKTDNNNNCKTDNNNE